MQGLGKTITGLVLIMRTLGRMPAAPLTADGKPAEMTWVKDSCGRQAAYYSGVHLHDQVSNDKKLLLGAVQSCVCSLHQSLLGVQCVTLQSVHMHNR